MPIISCVINHILTWCADCALSHTNANQATTFAKTATKLYFPVVTFLTQVNAKLLQQLKSGFKHKIN